eukprot:gene9342-9505_t
MPAPVLSQTPLVLASWFCPFAQRTLIALNTKQLLPSDSVARASARKIIGRFDSRFVPAFYRFLVQQDPEVQAAAAETISEELTWLLQMMISDGPLTVWPNRVSLVDCAVAPFLMRLYLLEHYRGYTYNGPMAQRLEQYLVAVQEQPAVAATCYHPTPHADYKAELLKSYARYADGSANSLMARDAKQKK